MRNTHCAFKLREKGLYLFLYVDDTLTMGKCPEDICNTKKVLGEQYDVKVIRMAEYFLGVEIHRQESGTTS